MRQLQTILIAGSLALAGAAVPAPPAKAGWVWAGFDSDYIPGPGGVEDCNEGNGTYGGYKWSLSKYTVCTTYKDDPWGIIFACHVIRSEDYDQSWDEDPDEGLPPPADICLEVFGSPAQYVGGSTSPAVKMEPERTRQAPKRDEGIASIQKILAQCDFNPGPIDGLWGRKTAAAAAEFVKAHGGAPKEARLDLIVQVDGYRIGDAGPCPRQVDVAGKDLSGQDFRNADLADKDLAETKFRDADLSGADLSGANLDEANLSGADLSGAHLEKANLSGANLDEANLSGAHLEKANLDHASLNSANLSGANLSGANLSGTNLSGTNLSGARLEKANLAGANLAGANFKEAVLDRANLVGADLRKTLMIGASLSGAALSGVRFSGATGLAVAQLSVAHWAGRAAEWVQKEAFEDIKEGTDKLMAVIVEDDGSFRIPVPKGQ